MEGQSWCYDSDSDDSIVVTISQMQDEAAKLQSTTAEIRQELSGLLATLDDIEHRSITDKHRKVPAKGKPESGDSNCEDPRLPELPCAATLEAVEEGKELTDSDDRYRDVTTSWRRGSRGDMTSGVVDASQPVVREIIDSVLDAVMERQAGAGDSLDAHPQRKLSSTKDEQSCLKSCLAVAEGRRSVGDVEASTHSSDSDDHDVVVDASWRAGGRRRPRRRRQPGSEGSVSSEARSSSTADEAFIDADADADAADSIGGHLELLDSSECPYYLLD